MKKETKSKIIFTAIFLAIVISSVPEHEYHPNYRILEDEEAYACYRDGDIYIGDEDFLKSISCNPEDVLICDKRDCDNSDFVVYDSYKITDKEARNDIIEVLLHYEEENPSEWDRTKESMRLEWYMHNLSHDLHIRRSNSSNVDLDNNDEKIYGNKVLRKIFNV